MQMTSAVPTRIPTIDPEHSPQNVLLLGFQDQDNLGLRYLMSAVNASGHRASIMTYGSDPELILRRIRHERPDVVGFSLIFQYMAPDFGRVIDALREGGVAAHFTMGGHFSSFEPAEILERMPGLDTVIRFEGEMTLVKLLHCLSSGSDWRALPGIAFRSEAGRVAVAPLAPVVDDLDILPRPDRHSIDYEHHPMPTASILGSRGCPWDCAFCSIRPFYEEQGGALRRLRKPQEVVDEMIDLHVNRKVPIFLFQDDDFLAGGKSAKRWAMEIADRIAASAYSGEIAFKISCRSDEVHEEIMERLVAGGLTHVYLGVESGDEEGLLHMNKRMKPEAHVRAGRILRKFGLSFDFGFMMLEPYSTLAGVRRNVDFLEEFVGDGWTVAAFCRMLPYAGTPVKRKLEAEGRLLGTLFDPDYKFLDPKLDVFYDWMIETFYRRNFTNEGLSHLLRALLFEAHLRLPGRNGVSDGQRLYLRHLTSVCNRVACYTLRSALAHIEATPLSRLRDDRTYLQGLAEHERREEARLTSEVGRYYEWVHRDRGLLPGPAGGFENSWTFNEGDREAAGVGAA